MSTKMRHPDTCPSCDYFPCRCLGGGGSDDEKNSKSKKDTNAEKDVNRNKGNAINIINNISSAIPSSKPVACARNDAEEFQKNRPAWCMFFAENAKQPMPTPSDDLQQDNATNNTRGLGLSMSDMDE